MMQLDTSSLFKTAESTPDIGQVVRNAMSISEMLDARNLRRLQGQQIQQEMNAYPAQQAAKSAAETEEQKRKQQEFEMKLQEHKEHTLRGIGDVFDSIDPDKDPDWKAIAIDRAKVGVDEQIYNPKVLEQIQGMSAEQFKGLRDSSNLARIRLGVAAGATTPESLARQKDFEEKGAAKDAILKAIAENTDPATGIFNKQKARETAYKAGPVAAKIFNESYGEEPKPKAEGGGSDAKTAEKIKKSVNDLFTLRGNPMTKARIEYDAAMDAKDILSKGTVNGYDLQAAKKKLDVSGATGSLFQKLSELASRASSSPQRALSEAERTALLSVAERELSDNSRKLLQDLGSFEKTYATELNNTPEALSAFNDKKAYFTYTPEGGAGGTTIKSKSGQTYTF